MTNSALVALLVCIISCWISYRIGRAKGSEQAWLDCEWKHKSRVIDLWWKHVKDEPFRVDYDIYTLVKKLTD